MYNPLEIPSAIFFLVHITISLNQSCPKQDLCECKFYGNEVDLYCVGTEHLIDLRQCLMDNFANFHIRVLYVKECNATSLPSRFIQNLTLRMLKMKCPLESIPEDAFVGSYEYFYEIYLLNHNLTSIPDVFSSTPQIKRLFISNGSLETVGEELQYLKNLQILSLIRNRIDNISRNAFTFATNLLQLFLNNNRIKYIHPTAFASCRKIDKFYLMDNQLETAKGLLDALNPRIIRLDSNNLTDIDIFHRRMWRTIKINLSNNPFGRIGSSVFRRYFAKIQSLSLANMRLTDIAEDAFSYLPSLTIMDLSKNQMESIRKGTFKHLSNLETLDLSENDLSSIQGIFHRLLRIKTLLLSANRIKNLEDSLYEVPNIKELNLDKNEIYALTDDNFQKTGQIRLLSARRNNISIITKYCFQRLLNIVEIDLTGNALVSLNGSIKNLFTLQKLYLPYNRIEKLDHDDFANLPSLKQIKFQVNRLRSLNGQFRYLNSLEYLNLQENRILTLSRNMFPNVFPIEQLYIEGNPLVCDCRLEWLRKLIQPKTINSLHSIKFKPTLLRDNPICKAPYWLKGKYFKNVSINDLVEWQESCPSSCKCSCVPNELKMGISVDCSHRNLTEIPDVIPPRMIGLDISYNNLSSFQIPFVNSSWFHELQDLNIENNEVVYVKNLHSTKHLSVLKMANNRIEILAAEDMLNYSLVTASGNPWLCDCSSVPFRKWLLTLKDRVIDINQTKCSKGTVKSELRNTPIIYLSESQICPPKVALYILISVGVLGILVIVSTAALTYFRFGLSIKIWLYSHGFTWVKEDEIDKDKLFDAFLSYSSYDEEFIHGILRPTLENGFPEFFLCIHERNFVPGNEIYENIIQAVRWSRRTVLVLSKNFLESDWCILEFRTAHLQALKDKINRVIVIVYGELPADEDIDKELKVYLDNVTYLKWGDKYFWEKLRYALPKVKGKREKESLRFDETAHLLIGY